MSRYSDQQLHHPIEIYVGEGPEADRFVRRLNKELLRLMAEAGQAGEQEPERGQERSREKDQELQQARRHKPAELSGWLAAGLKPLPEGAAPLRMNSGAQAFAARSAAAAARRLSLAGLVPARQGKRRDGYRRRFEVTVFGVRAVHTAEVGGVGAGSSLGANAGAAGGVGVGQEESSQPDSPWHRRLEKLAVKALYTQGLDFGQVTLEAGDAGWEIARMTACPAFRTPEAARAFAAAVLETAEGWRAEAERGAERLVNGRSAGAVGQAEDPELFGSGSGDLLLGMDPEFLLFDPGAGKIIPASRFLSRTGAAGCDSVWIRGRRRFPLAELRPDPAGEPKAALRQLMGAMREAARQIGDAPLAWLAGGLPQPGLPLGGHLHFSGVVLTPQLLRALDHFLALPVALLEDSRSASRRPRYGCLGDFRRQSHGGFEYRTLPSFLVSPVVTKGTVALALLVASVYKSGALPEVPPLPASALEAFYTGDRTALRPFALRALEQAEALPSFSSYQLYIDPMFKAVRSGRTWDESVDIRKAWKLAGNPPGQRA
ncbi:hypothetical protein AWM70_08735 [Paenibacillus yonginensis]|uniref:Phage phiEco32-like COOH-NH2 ligase-type 2 n=2 Tax=Paenibacillus yonginensis TaxID=1462996 RepID=A0A1B1MZR3_9BACL|nr:hypothetical protein AWM70_08735 [Paenibacillus yonginensis]